MRALFTHCTRLSAVTLVASLMAMAPALAQDTGNQGLNLDVPYVPTPDSVVEKMLDLAQVEKGENLIDLGSGDGRIAIAAAKRGARAYGVDIDPARILEAEVAARDAGLSDRVTFKQQNLFNTNLTDADVITMYLLPSVNRDLRSKILDLKPGTRIVSHAFDMGEWEADQRETVGGRTVYYWSVPAKLHTRWNIDLKGQKISLSFTQTYQKLKGSATVGDQKQPVTGRISGSNVTFVIGEGDSRRELKGRINGNVLEPVDKGGWTATRA